MLAISCLEERWDVRWELLSRRVHDVYGFPVARATSLAGYGTVALTTLVKGSAFQRVMDKIAERDQPQGN